MLIPLQVLGYTVNEKDKVSPFILKNSHGLDLKIVFQFYEHD